MLMRRWRDGLMTRGRTGRVGRPAGKARGTVGSAIREWWDSVEWDGLKPGTQTSYTTYITPLYRSMSQVELATVRRSHLMRMRDEIATGRGHGAALVFCHAVSAFFSWAMERELVEASPAMKVTTRRSWRCANCPSPTGARWCSPITPGSAGATSANCAGPIMTAR